MSSPGRREGGGGTNIICHRPCHHRRYLRYHHQNTHREFPSPCLQCWSWQRGTRWRGWCTSAPTCWPAYWTIILNIFISRIITTTDTTTSRSISVIIIVHIITSTSVLAVLELAARYQVEGLVHKCADVLARVLDDHNACPVLMYVD
jgi:hypothetical protein